MNLINGDILRLVVAEACKRAIAGIALGLAVSLALTGFMTGFLYGVKATDLLTFVGVVALLLRVTLVACYVPARRAMRVNPIVMLHYE